MKTQIIPRYKMLLCYDMSTEDVDAYYQFVTRQLVPGLQKLGLYMYRVYHTAYGNYPMRQVEFLAETLDDIRKARESETWKSLETLFKGYITNYTCKVYEFRETFQF